MNLQQLLKECAGGKEKARKQLFTEISGNLFALCRRYVKNTTDAEELMLDGVQKIFSGLNRFTYQTDAGFYAWTRKIVVNQCLMFLRKENVFSISIEQYPGEVQAHGNVFDQLSVNEIYDAILQLPAGYRTVFNLYEIEGYSHKEIAEALGISEGTSKSQLSKAKSWLQRQLTKKETHEQRKIQ